jgi:hypothetical protein
MKLRAMLGTLLVFPAMFGLHLIWISGAMLHFFTAIVAFEAGGFLAGGAAFAFPIVGEIGVGIYAWNTSGSFVNGYSIWVLAWLGFLVTLLGLIGAGAWLGSSTE